MGRNNSHNTESYEHRLERFKNNGPVESIETLLNSIANFFNNEISIADKQESPQTSLLFMGIHAVGLTIAESFWNKRGLDGYREFLSNFIDGETKDTKFSEIAEILHSWRNTVAHKWINQIGHQIEYDYTSPKGWFKEGEIYIINPSIYLNCYLKAFDAGGKIWKYGQMFNDNELEEIKARIINQFTRK